jgi:hypothetical protein
MPFLIIISRKDNEDVAVLLPQALFRFSSLLLRIENPYTQWVWIANPDQRLVAEHPLDQGEQQGGYRTSAMTGNTSSSAKLSREVAFQFFQFHISWKYGIPHGG